MRLHEVSRQLRQTNPHGYIPRQAARMDRSRTWICGAGTGKTRQRYTVPDGEVEVTFLSVKQVAARYGLTEAWVYLWFSEGE